MKHRLIETNGFWQCTVCQWRWSSRRRTACPGMQRYTLDTLPPYLKTLPQLESLGLRPPDLVPDGCYYRRLAPHWLYFYDVRQSLPLQGRPLQRLSARVNRWLHGYNRCQWCGWSAPSDPGAHPLPGGFCSACRFEQAWLRQCRHIQLWAQERLHSERVIILDTETVGSLNDLDLSELAILDMQGRVLLDTQLRHRRWTATLEWYYPWTWSSVRLTSPPPGLADIWPQVMAIFERSSIVIAYNVAFHHDALAQSARRYGLFLPPLKWECLMNIYAIHYGQVRLEEHSRLDERDPFRWQSRAHACKQQRIPYSQSERAKQHATKDLAILQALAAGAQQWQE